MKIRTTDIKNIEDTDNEELENDSE